MAKAKQKRRPPAPAPTPAKTPIGKWILYGVIGAAVIALIAYLAIPPEEIPDELPPGIEEVAVADSSHVDGPIEYDRAVPAGGRHNPDSLRCAIYDDPVPAEIAVHTLEHGAVWITYQNDDVADVGALERLARTRSKVILSPVPNQEAPIMATAWGWQLELQDAGDIRLPQFINATQGSFSKAPESGAPC